MPESGRYEKVPRPESIETLCRYLRSNPVVSSVESLDSQLVLVRRTQKSDLKVFLTNAYIVGEADAYEAFDAHQDLDAIVTMSAWNSYTRLAKELCKSRGVGLFKFKEFLGAVYYDKHKFMDY